MWLSGNTKEAIKHKHQMRKEHGHTFDGYRSARGVAKTMVQQDRLKQIEKNIDKISTLPPHKQYHAALKKTSKQTKARQFGVKDKNGNIVTDKERVLERWAESYEDLYNDTPSGRNNENSSQDDGPIPVILKSEVENAVLNLKIGKSAGLDDMYSEYIKAGGEPIVQALLYLYNQVLRTGIMPDKFKQALIVVIFKKGSSMECGNYRPISLLSHIYEVFISIIANRIK